MDTTNLREAYLQAMYIYRNNIGWISSVEFSEEIPTACVDTFHHVQVGIDFCQTHLKSLEDWAFILAHEAAHKSVATILASNFELNWRYSILCDRFSENFMQDLFINQMVFHAIPSTVPERFYRDTKSWELLLLQRSPKILKKLPTSTPELENKLKLYMLACNHWYKSAETPDLYKVYETACDYLLYTQTCGISPQSSGKDLMVVHSQESEKELGSGGSDPNSDPLMGSDSGKLKYKLRIPYTDDIKKISEIDYDTYCKIQSLQELIEARVAKIPDYFGNKSYVGYTDPQPDDLVAWNLEQYIPWTERFQVHPARKVHVVFDVSGSMFPYLALLNKVRHLLDIYNAEFYAFSTIISRIDFLSDHAETFTGAGTDLHPILTLLTGIEPGLVFIISDGQWALSKKRSLDEVEEIFNRHEVIIFQQGISKIPYIPSDIEIIPIGL